MRVLVGMSGGVDSTVSALLLKSQGYEPVGLNLILNGNPTSAKEAERCAEYLNIEFHTADFSDDFTKLVKSPFAESYLQGETPNPCVICNREIKFGLMLKLLEKYNCEKLATGHYVKSEYSEKYENYILKKGDDLSKDQSYFLWELTPEKIAKTVFPLGGYTKNQVREIAARENLPCAKSPESQDVCFIPDGDCGRFIASFSGRGDELGKFVDTAGNVLGRHRGIAAYTVGQRKGLGISAENPLYVLKKRADTNTVILGKNEELFSDTVFLRDINLIADKTDCGEFSVDAKIRYSLKTAPGVLTLHGNSGELRFDSPQRAPTPGQSAVFYDGDTVIGGGIITEEREDVN